MKDALGVYLSIPFCRSKCTYCNFASGVYPAALEGGYVDRICAGLESVRSRLAQWDVELPELVDSVYLGGGTPAILPAPLLRRLWDALRATFHIVKGAEITFECAPGQLGQEALDAMLSGGANRVSFGVQSFVDREASSTGRLHTRETALADLRRVRLAGIENINVDLIAGLPHQSRESWRESLETLTGAGANHASVYMLEVDEESRLGRELISGGSRYCAGSAPGDDLTAELYADAVLWLDDRGVKQYEISNFAIPGFESVHNRKYWRRQPYLGLGLDAHSMLRRRDGAALRLRTADVLEKYLAEGGGFEEIQTIAADKELEEAWFLGLRLREGVVWRALEDEFGARRLAPFAPVINELLNLRLVQNEHGRLSLTSRGFLLSNEVFERFLGAGDSKCPA